MGRFSHFTLRKNFLQKKKTRNIKILEKSNFLLSLICLVGILFQLNINAQAKDPTLGISDSNGNLTPQLIIAGILLIITGIIFCFFGRRIYRLTLFMIGFYIGSKCSKQKKNK